VQLSIRYGIVTPYTSYLVTEPSLLGAEERERIISEEVQKFNDLATMPTFGREAVEQAEGQNSLASADAAPEAPTEAIGKVRIIGAQTFILSDGIWTDTRFDPDLVESTKIEFLSEQYFSLARNHPQLAKAFALGTQVKLQPTKIINQLPRSKDRIKLMVNPNNSLQLLLLYCLVGVD